MSYLQQTHNVNLNKYGNGECRKICKTDAEVVNRFFYKDKWPNMSQKFSLLIENWLRAYCMTRLKPTTYDSYSYCANKYIIPFFESLDIKGEELLPEHIQAFVEFINNHSWLSQTYKRKILTVLKTFIKKLFQSNSEYEILLNAFDLPKTRHAQVEVFSIYEQRRIEAEILKCRDLRMHGILLAFYTGIRLGELCAIKWEDIDFDTGTLSIKRSVSRTLDPVRQGRTRISINTPKSYHSIRKIPLPAFLFPLLSEISKGKIVEENYVFSNKDTPTEPRTYQRTYKKLIERAGVPYRKFHAIRHTFATRALEVGVDVKTLSELLGHSSATITLNIYVHSLMKQKILAIDKMNNLYKNEWVNVR